MFQYTQATFSPPIIFWGILWSRAAFIFLVAWTKKVSPHKICPKRPIRQAETTVQDQGKKNEKKEKENLKTHQ